MGPILCQKILIYKKDIQRYIHGNNYMTPVARFTHCDVGEQAASIITGGVCVPRLALEQPLLCAGLCQVCLARNSPFLLEALPALCLSQPFPDGAACFLQLCLTGLSHGITLPGSSP